MVPPGPAYREVVLCIALRRGFTATLNIFSVEDLHCHG